ncbi:MAG: GT4 family glycosyltransferase PelF [Candidatus Scalindua sp.]|nr:GT4 family glycosyltransferase PelF [Candidatus Scalindua sp.]
MANRIYDVCLILEGSYPFVEGGVSRWMHFLIKSLPEISFTAVCISTTSKEKQRYKYEIPHNLSDIKVVYLSDYSPVGRKKSRKVIRTKQTDSLRAFHHRLFQKDLSSLDEVMSLFNPSHKERLTLHDMIFSKESWELLLDFYKPDESDFSFIDYFWTFRVSHLSLFNILNAEVPRAKVYHTISTGYAGFMGAFASRTYKRPLILTEHGIYTKERKIDIAQAEWIYASAGKKMKVEKDLGTLQNIWVRIFESMGKFTYNTAERIYTLYEGNRRQQVLDGADPDKTFVIPNGIDIARYKKLYVDRNARNSLDSGKSLFSIGFVGRVVPIKDVKTFIRACKVVSLRVPNINIYIIGPTDENAKYYQECLELCSFMGIKELIKFVGQDDTMKYYSFLDLVVLTSVSEAQPLVVLEANCAGVPVVASDVGACRELLEGNTEEDKALGVSGIVTRVVDPADTADGIITILTNDVMRKKMSIAGHKRVETFYRESDLNEKYLSVYKEFMKREDIGEL